MLTVGRVSPRHGVWHDLRVAKPMTMNNAQDIDTFIGRPILSIESANKLGQVHDLVVDPIRGELVGFSVQRLDETYAFVEQEDIHGIGPHAVMVAGDESLISPDQSLLKSLPLAKTDLIGVKVITEGGAVLGAIANVYVLVGKPTFFIYEVRSSILDRLLGHSLYFPASFGCALSADATRLVVSNETEKADHKLEEAANHFFSSCKPGGPEIIVRSRTH